MRNRFAGNRGFAKCTGALLLAIMAACELSTEPEVRENATEFPLRANWSATLAPVGTAAVIGNLTIAEYLGSHFDATASITGGRANTAYQWRIFRGDCATNTAAPNAQSPTGLLLYGTIQAYPDLTTDASGAATVSRAMAGALDSLTAYSVRVRLGQSATNWNGTNPLACGNLQRS
jgi:hypothetical protein